MGEIAYIMDDVTVGRAKFHRRWWEIVRPVSVVIEAGLAISSGKTPFLAIPSNDATRLDRTAFSIAQFNALDTDILSNLPGFSRNLFSLCVSTAA